MMMMMTMLLLLFLLLLSIPFGIAASLHACMGPHNHDDDDDDDQQGMKLKPGLDKNKPRALFSFLKRLSKVFRVPIKLVVSKANHRKKNVCQCSISDPEAN